MEREMILESKRGGTSLPLSSPIAGNFIDGREYSIEGYHWSASPLKIHFDLRIDGKLKVVNADRIQVLAELMEEMRESLVAFEQRLKAETTKISEAN